MEHFGRGRSLDMATLGGFFPLSIPDALINEGTRRQVFPALERLYRDEGPFSIPAVAHSSVCGGGRYVNGKLDWLIPTPSRDLCSLCPDAWSLYEQNVATYLRPRFLSLISTCPSDFRAPLTTDFGSTVPYAYISSSDFTSPAMDMPVPSQVMSSHARPSISFY